MDGRHLPQQQHQQQQRLIGSLSVSFSTKSCLANETQITKLMILKTACGKVAEYIMYVGFLSSFSLYTSASDTLPESKMASTCSVCYVSDHNDSASHGCDCHIISLNSQPRVLSNRKIDVQSDTRSFSLSFHLSLSWRCDPRLDPI